VKFFSAINQPHYTNLDGLDLNLNQPSTENPDIGINYNLGSDSNGSTNAQTPEKAVNLEPIIRNPTTGITYYLDKSVNRYYYQDPETKQMVYYNSGSGSGGSTNGPTPEKGGNLEPIIRNPTTGITYYLDKSVNRYYYQDPQTKQMVYYNSGSGSGGSTKGPTPEKGGNLEPIIRNPTTGITYYLDKSVNRYYYQDPQTKQMVYYGS
jgi:phage pi2 protein 07